MSAPNRAFTLIEVIIVIALFSVLLGLGLLLGMDVLRGTSRRSSAETLVAALAEARSKSLAREQGTSHGVCTELPDIVLFAGERYDDDPAPRRTPADPQLRLADGSAFLACSDGGIVFTEGSATTTGGRIELQFPDRHTLIIVNTEGTIVW